MANNGQALIASLENEIHLLEQQLEECEKQRRRAESYGLDQRLEAELLVKKISEMRESKAAGRSVETGSSGSSRDRTDRPCKSSISINGCFTYAPG